MAARHLLVTVTALCLAGCGKPLGEYRFDNARLVPGDAANRIDPQRYSIPFNHYLIRIEFSSETDLEALRPNDIYVHGDFCPFRERYMLGIFGPFYNDRERYISTPGEAAEEGVTGTPAKEVIAGKAKTVLLYPNRHPRKDPRTGRYVYTAYLNPYAPADVPFGGGPADHPYDLRTDHRDLCLQIDSPGYNITESRSQRFTIPGTAIAAAIARGGSH